MWSTLIRSWRRLNMVRERAKVRSLPADCHTFSKFSQTNFEHGPGSNVLTSATPHASIPVALFPRSLLLAVCSVLVVCVRDPHRRGSQCPRPALLVVEGRIEPGPAMCCSSQSQDYFAPVDAPCWAALVPAAASVTLTVDGVTHVLDEICAGILSPNELLLAASLLECLWKC